MSGAHSDIIKAWVEQYSDFLYALAYDQTSSRKVSEDLVQETFLAAFISIKTFEGRSNPRSWLLGILKHKLLDYYRTKSKTKQEFLMDNASRSNPFLAAFFNIDDEEKREQGQNYQLWDTDQQHLLDDRSFYNTLQQCLAKLPPTWSEIIYLKFLVHKDSHAICSELNITSANLWQMLQRAKRQLKKCLEKNWFNI